VLREFEHPSLIDIRRCDIIATCNGTVVAAIVAIVDPTKDSSHAIRRRLASARGVERAGTMTSTESAGPVVHGRCHVYYALDIGFSVDLSRCAALIQETREAGGFQHNARTPANLNLRPAPVRISHTIDPIRGQTFVSEDSVKITIYDFGAVSVEYRVPFQGTLDQIAVLSNDLYDNPRFAADARARAESLLAAIGPAVRRGGVREEVEDYLIFAVPSLGEGGRDLGKFLGDNRQALAQVLSSNTKTLSHQQWREELSGRISYYEDDLTIITWNAALVFGTNMEDILTVLELANVQLRELHYLDDQLDDSLKESYDIRAQTKSVKTSMRRIRELMLDGQAFSEAVTNAFKPFPDAFLARVYVLASQALGLNHVNRSIKDKLSLLNMLYTTLSDEADHERSLRLEWIVIILIFIEIIMGFSEKLLPLFHRG
jgi:hypothetical protein